MGDAGRDLWRFIPAGAGNASSPRVVASAASVHPRGCGERFKIARARRDCAGSSPRVRGTQRQVAGIDLPRRFIPAGAGNAAVLTRAPRSHPVHPRGCGERGLLVALEGSHRGSSPRVRGTHPNMLPRTVMMRFIPAGAGNARSRSIADPARPVHPRGCGERGCPLSIG